MPSITTCSACSTKLKIRDDLVGKVIKCPKCGKTFKAVAEEDAKVAASAPAKKPAAWDKEAGKAKALKKPVKSPPARNTYDDDDEDEDEDQDGPPDDSEDRAFEDLLEETSMSSNLKRQIASELNPREKGVWVGQPDPRIMTLRGIPKGCSGAVALGVLTIIASVMTKVQFEINLPPPIIGGIVVLWAILSFFILVLVLFMERRKALHTAYVITNKRCITFTPGWFFAPYPTSYHRDLLMHMRRMPSWIFGNDAGDLVFRSMTTITTTYHRRGGTSRSVRTTYYGFLAIRQLNEVADRIHVAILDQDEDDDDRRSNKKKKKGSGRE
jgi:predicted Zn finger-like uncharacterized protein